MTWWPFKTKQEVQPEVEKVVDCENVNENTVPEAVKPADGIIYNILTERFTGAVPRQWVNWAAEQIGEEPKYFSGYPMTIRSLWVLYEGCKLYVEGTKNESIPN